LKSIVCHGLSTVFIKLRSLVRQNQHLKLQASDGSTKMGNGVSKGITVSTRFDCLDRFEERSQLSWSCSLYLDLMQPYSPSVPYRNAQSGSVYRLTRPLM
jgi:hypothetical protein